MGSVFCAAASPIIGTIVLGREMTANEVYRSTLSCLLGPVGWWIGTKLLPVEADSPSSKNGKLPPPAAKQTGRTIINIPPAGETRFVPNEVLLEFKPGTSARYLDQLARNLQMTRLESHTFILTGHTVQRWRIDGARSVAATLRELSRYTRISAGQPNHLYRPQQSEPALTREVAVDVNAIQYVIAKLHLPEAHRITNGDDVLVAVIDSKIDTGHDDLAGAFAGEYDALDTPASPHSHGTGMAGAIAAHAKLVGVAPRVKLLAIRVFSGDGSAAEGTTFNILKGLDYAAGQNARVINMSFAGPKDRMFQNMLAEAHARGMVLVAAVGNAGPRSPPLYPAAAAHVVGVTATDADDKVLPQANRGWHVAVAAPGVDILVPAPNASYQTTTGTSVAAAHVSGVVALLLANNPKLSPRQVRRILLRTASVIGKPRDVGAGLVDALAAVRGLPAQR